jgi:GNAT superfamily N-acetyltransferase
MMISIRPTLPTGAPLLPAIEQSAGELFRTIPELAWIADGDNIPPQRHLELIADGACWVAEAEDGSLAGLLAAQLAGDALHIWELSVRKGQQRKGIGRALVTQAAAFARKKGLQAVTLSTFVGVAWNEPMYRRLGFMALAPEDCDERLQDILRNELAAGLPGERRCAMRMQLARANAA